LRQAKPIFFQEGADLGQAAADTGEAFDGLLGLACVAGRVVEEGVFQRGLGIIQFAVLAGPTQAANPLEAALLVLVEGALHGAWRDVGEFGNGGVGQAPALEPQHLDFPLDAGVRVVVAVVAYLRQDFLPEDEITPGSLPATGTDGYNHAVGIRSSGSNSASLSRGEYNKALPNTDVGVGLNNTNGNTVGGSGYEYLNVISATRKVGSGSTMPPRTIRSSPITLGLARTRGTKRLSRETKTRASSSMPPRRIILSVRT